MVSEYNKRKFLLLLSEKKENILATLRLWEEEKSIEFYLFILYSIENAIFDSNKRHLRKYCDIINFLNSEKEERILKSCFCLSANPFQFTNVVILSCKHNIPEILHFVLNNDSVLGALSTGIGREAIQPYEEDDEKHNAFYYAIRVGNVKLLEMLRKKWGFITKHYQYNIAKAYEELKLRNVVIKDECQLYVEKELLSVRFFTKADLETQQYGVAKDNITRLGERIKFVLHCINILTSCNSKIDDTFLWHLNCIAQNLYILKNQLKSTYTYVPWEEMEFLSVVFKMSQDANDIIFILFRVFVSKIEILHILKHFACSLTSCLADLKTKKYINHLPNCTRDEVVKNIIKNNRHFSALYKIYSKVRDIYSLNVIKTYLKVALKAKPSQREGQLVVIRAVQILGEHLKCTLTSPKLSSSTCDLLLWYIPKYTRHVILKMRDLLSHGKNFPEPLEDEFICNIQKDLKKINGIILKLHLQYQMQLIGHILNEIVQCNNLEKIQEIAKIFTPNFDSLFPVFEENDMQTDITQIINKIRHKICDKTCNETELFNEIEDLVNYGTLQYKYLVRLYVKSVKCLAVVGCYINGNTVERNAVHSIESILRNIMNQISLSDHSYEDLVQLLRKLLESLKSRMALDNSCEIINLFSNIFSIVDLNQESYLWLKEFLDKLHLKDYNPAKTNMFNKDLPTKAISSLLQKIKVLRDTLQNTSLCDQTVENFNKYKEDKNLQIVLEILVLDVLSVLGDVRNIPTINTLFFDAFSPLLMGKILRNHLAHENVLMKAMLCNPMTAVLLNAQMLVSEHFDNIKGKASQDNVPTMMEKYIHELSLLKVQQQLFEAFSQGNLEAAKLCLQNGADVHARNFELWTSLHFACKGPSLACVRFVIDNKVEINCKDHGQRSPLHIATLSGRKDIVQYLVEGMKMLVDDSENTGKTCLHLAAQHGYTDIVEVLLKNNASTCVKDCIGYSPIHYAAQNNHESCVEVLLKQQSNANDNVANSGYSILHIAAEFGRLRLVKLLLEANANVNAVTETFTYPIHRAAFNGHSDIVELLIREGAFVNVKTCDGIIPLHYAAKYGHSNVVSVLLQHGAHVNTSEKVSGMTPLSFASSGGYKDIVQLLLSYGAYINTSSLDGRRPVHHAVENGHVDVVEILFQKGAETNAGVSLLYLCVCKGNELMFKYLINAVGKSISTIDQENLLHLSVENGNARMTDILIEMGVDINKVDENGNTPLHLACLKGHVDIVKGLIRNKAKLNVLNNRGESVIHCAVTCGKIELVKNLLKTVTNHNNSQLNCAIFIAIKNENDISPLYCAIENDNECIAKLLVEYGAKVNDICNEETMLSCAVKRNNKNIVSLLLINGADVNAQGGKALIYAVQARNERIISRLLCDKSFNITVNTSALMTAIVTCNINAISSLLRKGANPNIVASNHMLSPLHYAASNGKEDIVKLLLENNADVNMMCNGETPLHLASGKGHEKVVQLLLNFRADKTLTDNEKRTCLQLAVANGHIQVVELLLEKDDIEKGLKNCNGFILLLIAAQYGQVELTDFLIKRGANAFVENKSASKPIHIAAREGHLMLVQYYLNKMVALKDQGVFGRNLLHYAAVGNQMECAKYFIEKKIDVNSIDNNGCTALHLAAEKGNCLMVKCLLENGAFFDILNRRYQKPYDSTCFHSVLSLLDATEGLYRAVKCNNILKIKECIDLGAIVNAKGVGDVSFLHLASWKGLDEAVDILLKHEADPNIIGKGGCAPIHYAAKFSFPKIVRKFLINGAMYDVLSDKNKTPLDYAEKEDVRNLLKLVEKSFNGVRKRDKKIITVLERISDMDVIRCVMNAKNRENSSLIHFADSRKYPFLLDLMEIHQGHIHNDVLLANSLAQRDHCTEALHVLYNALDRRCKILKQNNQATLQLQFEIAHVHSCQEKFQNSLSMAEDVFLKQKEILGEDHTDTMMTESLIASILNGLGKSEEALSIFKRIYPKLKSKFGLNHDRVFTTIAHFAVVLQSLGKCNEALKLNQNLFNKCVKLLGPMNPFTLSLQNGIATNLCGLGKYEEAYKLFLEVYKKRKNVFGYDHSYTLKSLHHAGYTLFKSNKLAESLELLWKVLQLQVKVLGQNHFDTFDTKTVIGFALLQQGKLSRAWEILSESNDARKAILGPNHPRVLNISKLMEEIYLNLYVVTAEHFTETFEPSICPMVIKSYDIFFVSANGSQMDVEDFLKSGTSVNIQDDQGETPLHFAVFNGRNDIVNYLLINGADATLVSSKGKSVLHIAASKNDRNIVEILLNDIKTKNFKNFHEFVNLKTTLSGDTALHFTTDIEIVKLLLKHGAIYNVRNNSGKIPVELMNDDNMKIIFSIIDELYVYARNGSKKVSSALQKLPADIFIAAISTRNLAGRTIVQEAMVNKYRDLAFCMLKLMK